MEGEESEEKHDLFSKSSRTNSAVPDEKIEVLATTINDPDAISFSSMPITMNASMQSLRSSMQSLRSSRQSFHSPRQSLRSPRQSLFSLSKPYAGKPWLYAWKSLSPWSFTSSRVHCVGEKFLELS